MGGVYPSANYVIYVLNLSLDIYQDSGKLLTNFRWSPPLMKNQMNINQPVAAVNNFNNFVIQKTKTGNEQCTSTAPFLSVQLKLTDIPQSITDEYCNETKGMVENGSVLKGFGNLYLCTIYNWPNKPFQIIISGNSDGSFEGASWPLFIGFKVF